MERIPREEGRRLFGADPDAYDAARPPYPDWIFESLRASGALFAGAATLEIGPGSGTPTRRLLEHGIRPLTLIEPDDRLAGVLLKRILPGNDHCELRTESFEEADLPDGYFDLAVAATAFHWVDPRSGLSKLRRVLTPAGTAALIWNLFQDPGKPDPFHEATKSLLAPMAVSPSGAPDTLPWALDRAAREREARRAGFTRVSYEESRWSYEISTEQVGMLYANFSGVQRLPAGERSRLLNALMDIAEDAFAGRVVRNMTSCLYQLRN